MTETPRQSISTASVVLILGLALIAVGLIIGLVYLMGPDNGEGVLRWVTGLITLATGGAAGGAALMARRAVSGIEVVRQQTNGVLDQRIRDNVASALADHGVVERRAVPQDDEPNEGA